MREKIGDEARLRHIAEAIEKLESFIDGVSYDEFIKNELIKSAVVRQLEIIGEASNHLSEYLKVKYSEIIWTDIIGFRNIVVHEYFIVDYAVVWDILQNYLLTLKITITDLLNNEYNK